MNILVLDNYDSFTYNLVHMFRELCKGSVDVFRNDRLTLSESEKYDKIVISPGPGIPSDAGITKELIRNSRSKSILGVCLGCQAIAEVFGGTLVNLDRVYHGVATGVNIVDDSARIFHGIPEHFAAGRYHSWVVSNDDFPSSLKVTARDNDGMIMALCHREYDITGVQFHPESVLTGFGKQILRNWLNS
jgi:anthranilate synthase component 2